VRLVDPDGEQLGIKLLPEALAIARQLDLDLVEVAPGANPPVCRIMDYGKFKFDAAQRAKESRRKAVHVGIKEMKYRPKIGPGDFDTKTRQVAKFLEEGHKVKITIMFRGREVFHPELGKKILDRIAEQMDGMGKSEAVPRLDGRNMVMVLAPDKRAKQSAASKSPTHGVGTNGSVPTDRVAGGDTAGSEQATTSATAREQASGTASEQASGPASGREGAATEAGSSSTGDAAPEVAVAASMPEESSEGEGTHDAKDEN
jgi:translation initiation factor IF-3